MNFLKWPCKYCYLGIVELLGLAGTVTIGPLTYRWCF